MKWKQILYVCKLVRVRVVQDVICLEMPVTQLVKRSLCWKQLWVEIRFKHKQGYTFILKARIQSQPNSETHLQNKCFFFFTFKIRAKISKLWHKELHSEGKGWIVAVFEINIVPKQSWYKVDILVQIYFVLFLSRNMHKQKRQDYRVWVDGLIQEVWSLLKHRVLLYKQLLVKLLQHLHVHVKGQDKSEIMN